MKLSKLEELIKKLKSTEDDPEIIVWNYDDPTIDFMIKDISKFMDDKDTIAIWIQQKDED